MKAIYIRCTAYDSSVLTTDGIYSNNIISIEGNGKKPDFTDAQFIKVTDFSVDVEQTLNIGSQSTGAGAGKIAFNPLSIVKKMDAVSPLFFAIAASGTPFKTVEVFFTNESGVLYCKQTYKLVAVKTVSWLDDVEYKSINETVTFEYGGLVVSAFHKGADGQIHLIQNGWNSIRNVSDDQPDQPIT